MSFKSIRSNIAAETGFHPDTSDDDKAYLNERINKLAEDFYNLNDLPGSLKEVIGFFTDFNERLVSLPFYVGDLRSARYYDCPFQVTLRDIRPRYSTGGWTAELLDYREIGTSTLWIDNTEWSGLVFSLPEGEVSEKDVIITIVGATPVASNVEEQITLAAGENSVSSTNNWIEAPRVIDKNVANNFDILVSDINGIELALIPNNELHSVYSIWQVNDDSFQSVAIGNSLEFLYKERYKLMVNDYDEFLGGKFDDALKWKFLAEYWGAQDGKEELAQNALLAFTGKTSAINKNKSKGKKIELQTVPNKFYNLFSSPYYRTGRTGYN